MAYVNVKGHPGFVRDKASGAILNINSKEMSQARKRKKAWLDERQKTAQLETEVTELKDDGKEIKHLLNKILEATNG